MLCVAKVVNHTCFQIGENVAALVNGAVNGAANVAFGKRFLLWDPLAKVKEAISKAVNPFHDVSVKSYRLTN